MSSSNGFHRPSLANDPVRKIRSAKAKESDLAVFLRPAKKKNGWSDRKIRAFVRMTRHHYTLRRMAKELKLAEGTLKQMHSELKKAAHKGYTLDRYLTEGRPCRSGKQVLAA